MQKNPATRNPLEWSLDHLAHSWQRQSALLGPNVVPFTRAPVPRSIGMPALWAALAAGFEDFKAFRTDVIFLCILYPLAGLVLAKLILAPQLFQLAFPLAAGFALLGPVFATGLYQMSRARQAGRPVSWATAFEAFGSPAIGSIVGLGIALFVLFGAWVGVAQALYLATVAPFAPQTVGDLVLDVLTTAPGLALLVIGTAIGFGFAAVVLAISVVSFPLMLDRGAGMLDAVRTSLRVVQKNPRTMAAWGLIVAAGLVLGTLPAFIGLAVVLPVLGHATWHLYKALLPA